MQTDLSAEVKRAVREALAEIGTDKLASSVKTFAKRIDAGPTTVYAEIKAGRLKARRLGDKMVILEPDGRAYLASLPEPEAA